MSARTIRLVAVGDLLLGDSATSVGFGFRSRHSPENLPRVLEALKPSLCSADIAFGNLETVLSDRGLIANSWASTQLRGDPGYAPALRTAGFSVVNVANNHAAQHGMEAFEDSVRNLRSAGITPCGIRGTAGWASEPVRLEVGGSRIGILGYCLRPRQYGPQEPPYAEGDVETITRDIQQLRPTSDFIVVSLHWGEEFVPLPSEGEVTLARSLVDAGATLVLGHHPHVVRPVERYRHGLIAYSLGNCVGDMVWYAPFRRGALLSVEMGSGRAESALVYQTHLDWSYRPTVACSADLPVSSDSFAPMSSRAYAEAIRRTLRNQRLAVYWYVLMRAWRFPPRVLARLVARTARNKIAALVRRRGPA